MRIKCFGDENRETEVDLPAPLLPIPSTSTAPTRSTTPQLDNVERESSIASVNLEREPSVKRERSLSRQPSSTINKMFANRVVGVSRKITTVKEKKEVPSKGGSLCNTPKPLSHTPQHLLTHLKLSLVRLPFYLASHISTSRKSQHLFQQHRPRKRNIPNSLKPRIARQC